MHSVFSSLWYCFWGTVVKRFALYYRTVVCPACLTVTLVYCGQTVGWINIKLGMEIGLGPGHILLDGDTAPPPKNMPLFGPCLLWPNDRPSQRLLSSCLFSFLTLPAVVGRSFTTLGNIVRSARSAECVIKRRRDRDVWARGSGAPV